MKKYIFTYFFLLLLFINALSLFSQDNAIHSLQNFAESLHNDTAKVNTLIELSQKYQDISPDKAFTFAFQALILSTKINYAQGLGKAHNNLGDLYWYSADYVSSSEHYSEALKIFENLNDRAAIADCYRNIGWINFTENNHAEALNNYATALAINQELKRKKESGQNYNDIGIVYNDLKRNDEALKNYDSALAIQETEGNKKEMAAIYDNISHLYNDIGSHKLVIENMEKAIKISEEIGNKRYLAISYLTLFEYYMKENNIENAALSLRNSSSYANEIKDKEITKNIYLQYAKLYAKQNEFKEAFTYIEHAIALSDTIHDEANSRQLIEMAAKYEFDKKMRAINDLTKDKKISEEKLMREKKLKIYLASFCFMILVFAFILYRNNVQKQKANNALSLASHEIEEKNKSITDSINYAKRIQDVCLPPKDLKYNLFKDIFILFAPKDIVSGDFYWYTEKNGKKLIACCDCTGHGVPGALMSMIGNNVLNKIVNEKGITSPDIILNLLHKEIRKTLKQDELTGAIDGMDIALCSLTPNPSPSGEGNWLIDYAGANRPLWIIRKTSLTDKDGHENTEIKPDKFSIGGHPSGNEGKFAKHTLTLSKGDSIYIFSDGFIDQFGGEKNKKYTSKRFKELLVNNFKKTMPEQENILTETISEWKGNQEQVDDILVIGIKI